MDLVETTSDDINFHQRRQMFVLIDDIVETAETQTTQSHSEWFLNSGLTNVHDLEEFLEAYPRGFYWPETDTLYCYIGNEFNVTKELKRHILHELPQFIEKISEITLETTICFGPKDSTIKGISFIQEFFGTFREGLLQYTLNLDRENQKQTSRNF